MNRALALLIWLRFRGWWRRLLRNLGSVRGALFVAFGLLLSGCWVFSLLLPQTGSADGSNVETARRFGPLLMFGYCLLTILTSAGDRALTFSPAEVNLLFAGPFGRRQILGYKILTAALGTFFTTLVFTVLLRAYAPWLPAAFLALFLALLFLQFFGIAVALVSETLGNYASGVGRKVVLLVVGVLAAAVLLSLGRDLFGLQPLELLGRAEASPVLHAVLTPFRWFGDTFTAERLWPDLVQGLVLCLLADGALLAVVFLLDAQYLETASSASERLYAQLERMRAGPAAAMASVGGRPRFTLREFPRWGGAGPVAWRQALSALRNLKGLIFILLTFAAFLVVPLIFRRPERGADPYVPAVLVGTVLMMSIFLLQLLSFDFRGDLDRMDVLKALPVAPVPLVLGQLITPVMMACTVQMVSFVFIELVWGGLGWMLGAIGLFLGPFNLLLFAVMNLLFLWFPTRMTPATAGDFQMFGRQAMLFLAIHFLVFVLLLIPAGAGGLTYWLAGHNLAAGFTVAWVLLVGIVVGIVPLIALAFRNFDVARDTPP